MLDVIHQDKGLQGRVAALAADAEGLAAGGVEGGHVGRRGGAFPEGVEAASVEGVAGVLLVNAGVAAAVGDGFPDVLGLVGAHAFAAERVVHQTTDEEGVVAHDFGVEAVAGGAAEQAILGVGGEQFGADAGVLAVGGRGDDGLHEALHVPAFLLEGGGEPVEEFGMGGRLALRAEVVGGFHNAEAEELLPETVHRDARGEGMLRVHEPAGEGEAVGRVALRQRGENGGGVRIHALAGLVVLAADHHE